ncbi:MAG TPA: ABC transporter permease [Bryobacteraceae bacterium]|nr:ABC transporter permease [Bryobacteraceae bacterium]
MWWIFKHRRPPEAELDSELHFHIQKLIEKKMASGIRADEARRQAIIEFGGQEQFKEELRDVHRIATVENGIANLKAGIRLIRKSPTFSIAIILTLALGIGANSAVFSALDAVLIRPLAFPNADELMLLYQKDRKAKNPNSFVAPVRLTDWNRLNSSFQALSGWYTQDASETSGTLPEKITMALVAPRFLQVWGVAPLLGRDFTTEEEHFGGPNAVLISDRLWRRRLDADPNVVGKRLRLEKSSYTIVGVMPASFLFPDRDAEVWVPNPMDAPYGQSRESTWFTVIGRLKSGISVARARADMEAVQAELGRQYPKTDANLAVDVQPLKEATVGGVRRSLWVLFGSVSVLLLIACTNIAALLLARTTEREREIAIRFSLGASRASIIAQLLTECLVLSLCGAAIGILVAMGAANMLRALGKSFPRVEEITLDWRIVVYTLAAAVLAAILCGLLPAIRGTRNNIAKEVAHASRSQVSARNPLQWVLVGVQVALAVTLLVGAGLLLRSFQELARVSPGFDYMHVLTLRISANWGETADYKKLMNRIDRTLETVRAVPGVRSAAVSGMLPGLPSDVQTEVKLDGRSDSENRIAADSRFVSDSYFKTMRIPLLEGTECPRSLDAHYAVVNSSFAKRYVGGSSGIGRHLQLVSSLAFPTSEIVGVVGDAREQGLTREPVPTIYWCLNAPYPSPFFLIRTQGAALAMADTLRRKIHVIEPARSVYDISSLEEHLADNFFENRLRTTLLSLFAVTAMSLACVGLYGTLSYFVATRKREVGLRLALGAERAQILGKFLLKGVSVAFIGCVAGLALAAAGTRVLSGMLYGVSSTDVRTFSFVVFLILGVAGLASFVPALRAASVDPMKVLRDE